jgi:hypothetical protein
LRVVAAGLLALLGAPSLARADPATAEALFREGRRLLDVGEYEAACEKLAESQRQDAASGTLINLALCYERQGKLASAWEKYRAAASLARMDGRPDRQQSAEQKAAAIESRVPHLVFRMAGAPPPGLVIQGPSGVLGAGVLDSAIPVDPGSYRITVSAPGYREWTSELLVREGESSTVAIPALVAVVPATVSLPVVNAKIESKRASVEPARPPVREQPRSEIALWTVGGLSLAALGVGTYFGVGSLSAYGRAEDACPTHRGCSPEAMSDREEAQSKAWVANVSLGVGLIGAAAGAWLWLGARRTDSVAVRAAWLPGGGAFTIAASR